MPRLLIALFLFLIYPTLGTAQGVVVLSLQGEMDDKAEERVNQALASQPDKILVELNSSGGDLSKAMDIAKALYRWQAQGNHQLVVFVEDNALGPAALIPFLADELYTSVAISWGDLLLNADQSLPVNVLRARVRGLIDDNRPQASLLLLLAEAMVDPSVSIVDDGGWRRKSAADPAKLTPVTHPNERLVLGQNQLRRLGLLKEVMTLAQFRAQYPQAVQEQAETAAKVDTLMDRLREHIPYQPEGSHRIGHLLINDRKHGINQGTWLYVKSALDYYKKEKPTLIVLELDTPGGEVFAAQKISDALKEMDTQYGVPVVAYINNWAMSAGAMLAYSCRFIAIVKDASMGAAEPVTIGAEGQMQSVSEKINSAMRTDFANRAGFFDRDPQLAQAMVDKEMIIVLRRGKVLKLDSEDQIRREGMEPDEVISAKGKLLTLSAEQMIRLKVADLEVEPTSLELITEEERLAGKWPASKSLLFHAPYFKDIPDAIMDEYQMDWRTRLLGLLALPAVSSILFLGMMVGFYMELNTPGFGLPGSVGLICLFLIILGSYTLEVANWLEVLFVGAGLVLLALELFVIPGFGVAGIVGICFFVGGLFAIMLPGLENVKYDFDSGTLNASGEVFFNRLLWLSGTLIVGTVILALLGRYVMPKFHAFSRLVLKGEQEGYSIVVEELKLPSAGAVGAALTPLRPSGKVVVGEGVFDAQSVGGFVEKGAAIRVVDRTGNRVVVEEEGS